MTIKEVFIRFSLTYIVLIIALFIINALFLKHLGISPIRSVGIVLLIVSTMYACDAFAKKNKRYFTSDEKKKVIVGFIIIHYIFEGILFAFSGLAAKVGTNILLITIGITLITHPLIIYIFVGLTGIGAKKRYRIDKDKVGNIGEYSESSH